MKRTILFIPVYLLLLVFGSCRNVQETSANPNLTRAQETLDSIYSHYGVSGSDLLCENYPPDNNYVATYLASEEQANTPNQYSYLWPFSGTLSAVVSLLETTGDSQYRELLDNHVLKGLEEYFDCTRTPCGYASYLPKNPAPDRFYDDNVWLGIDFTDAYQITKNTPYLDKARMIWEFIRSGTDDKLDGGIYWCEQKKDSKNTCSNAPGSVLALKLFRATNDSVYFKEGKFLYEWTQKNLQDSTDYLYYDNINLSGRIGKAKFAYNSGQMIQSAVLLYKLTGNKNYLTDAQNVAKACYNFFFNDYTAPTGKQFRLLRKGDVWFIAVMLRGFIELYKADHDYTYLAAFQDNLDYAWKHSKDENGLFGTDWSGETRDNKKWLLTQAAMVEIYARMAGLKEK
ncbi:glycoside hydrolase family 76 protein [Bacteroides sp. 519]|uniref:glycoside hydrolase family 76 protein n=1 Tax=Bacteroides sp. 519 TaxID=2302937 RepID=UPI0013D4D270|nr:glycoside hydrolase family 76 protein [Bacteroides sp. 519]NDV60684.1 alpha-1,6-mannanase [Bacteroides sp. 519]